MIKPMLARGELRLIGATTLDEYRTSIEKDAAVWSGASNPSSWASPRWRTRSPFCAGCPSGTWRTTRCPHPGRPLPVAAAVLSDRYVTGRFLPDKAIDLIDEAASKLRIEIDSMPTELDQISRRIRQLKIEKLALEKESDEAWRSASSAWSASWPSWASSATPWRRTGSRRRAASTPSASCSRRGPPRRRRRYGWSVTPTWPARRPSATASCPSSIGASPRPTRTWPSCRPTRAS